MKFNLSAVYTIFLSEVSLELAELKRVAFLPATSFSVISHEDAAGWSRQKQRRVLFRHGGKDSPERLIVMCEY